MMKHREFLCFVDNYTELPDASSPENENILESQKSSITSSPTFQINTTVLHTTQVPQQTPPPDVREWMLCYYII